MTTPAGAPPRARDAHAALRGAVWAALGFAGVLAAAVLLPLAAGLRPYTVLSGSMAPAIATGDVVLTRPVAPRTVRPGDVVTFRDPSREARLITHRVRSVHVAGASAELVTRGDANTGAERWSVPADGRIGRVVAKLPRLGWLAAAAGTGTGRVLLIALPVVLLGLAELGRLWRGARPGSTSAAAGR